MSAQEEVEEAARLIRLGASIGWKLVDTERPNDAGLLYALATHRKSIGHGKWLDEDFVFIFEALRGFLGVGTAQLSGIGALMKNASEILLHPTITLVRGLAEACGVVVWMLEPLITPINEKADVPAVDWAALVSPVLSRSQLVMLDSGADREHRYRAEGKITQADAEQANFLARRERIVNASSKFETALNGKRSKWTIDGQRLQKKTDLAIRATEYSYGQGRVGTGMNPYPMLSGYAHASLDVVFAYGTSGEKPVLSTLFVAPSDEVKLISSLGLRLYSVLLDLVGNAIGESRREFESWDREVESYVVGV